MAGQLNPNLLLAVPLAPLAGSMIAGLFGTRFFGNLIGRAASHSVTILGVLIAFLISAQTLSEVIGGASYSGTLYTWMTVGSTVIGTVNSGVAGAEPGRLSSQLKVPVSGPRAHSTLADDVSQHIP